MDIFLPSGYFAVQWIPGIHLRFVAAPLSQVWGHGPLCKVLPDSAAGRQPRGGGAPPTWGGQPKLEGRASGLGVATCGSLCLCSPGLVWLQGMEDYTGSMVSSSWRVNRSVTKVCFTMIPFLWVQISKLPGHNIKVQVALILQERSCMWFEEIRYNKQPSKIWKKSCG